MKNGKWGEQRLDFPDFPEAKSSDLLTMCRIK